jgi:superfamily I DNA and RNA helicase
MFDQPQLWEDIGYKVVEGELRPGVHVKLERDENSSPGFLESHSDTDDLVQFIKFDTQAEQNEWVVEQIYKNLHEEELSPNDIVVINTDPLRTRSNLGPIRKGLLRLNVPNHLAGVDTVADVFFRPEGDSVTFTGIHRAKGNEAGMVYIVNADECQASVGSLSRVRNRLFTAITRSKAWVRVLGVGDAMEEMIGEYKRIRSENFALSFTYPTVDQRGKIEIIHRDMNEAEAENVAFRQATVTDLLQDLESGRLYREDLDPDLVERLTRLLRDPDAS